MRMPRYLPLVLMTIAACKGGSEDTGLDCAEGTHEEDGACVDDATDTGGGGPGQPEPEGSAAGQCSDGIDNDQDGIIDCADPDCQTSPECDGTGGGGGGRGGGGGGGATTGTIVQVATNGDQSCSLDDRGEVNCWGSNSGNYAYLDYEFVQIDGEGPQFCGVTTDADVICWGTDIWGSSYTAPESDFKHVAVGASHVCGINQDDLVECWGNDSYGQTSYRTSETVKQLDAGYYHTCAITMSDQVVCWGNYSSDLTNVNAPSGTYVDLDLSYWTSCALDDGGTAWCWGWYDSIAHGLTEVGSGYYYGCGIQTDESLSCWGTGGIFDQTETGDISGPPDGEFVQISTAEEHACALTSNGEVECWGDNYYGESSPP